MIIVKLMGGLGNQMFQYATGRSLADRHKTDLLLDASGYENIPEGDTPREYELGYYPLRAGLATTEQLARVKPAGYQPTLSERWRRAFSSNGPIFTFSEPSKNYYTGFPKLRNNTYLIGWWQDQKYFMSIRDKLLTEFVPQVPFSPAAEKTLQAIKAAPTSVSIHVRRGDYVTNPNANKHHGLAPIDYYNTAMVQLREQFQNATFFVFSDDITWCQANLKGQSMTYVEGTTAGYEDLHLMRHCQHNIIANSSFSWWGAWLNDSTAKTVIAPKLWFQDEAANAETDVVPEAWARL